MRLFARLALMVGFALLSGCAGTKGTTPTRAVTQGAAGGATSIASNTSPKSILMPELALSGKIVMVNPAARFAVLNFPLGQMPGIGSRLDAYRAGLKVGEVKISGPHRDDNIVADIVEGQCRAGDEVRGR